MNYYPKVKRAKGLFRSVWLSMEFFINSKTVVNGVICSLIYHNGKLSIPGSGVGDLMEPGRKFWHP